MKAGTLGNMLPQYGVRNPRARGRRMRRGRCRAPLARGILAGKGLRVGASATGRKRSCALAALCK
eukprot:9381944-Alexandrium_andersonii.AAC.1